MILMGSFYLQPELTAFQDNSFLLVHPPPFLMKGLQRSVVIVFEWLSENLSYIIISIIIGVVAAAEGSLPAVEGHC